MFYSLGLPNSVPEFAIQLFIMFWIVVLFQMILFLGFAMADPTGRRRSGQATSHSFNKDALDNDYRS